MSSRAICPFVLLASVAGAFAQPAASAPNFFQPAPVYGAVAPACSPEDLRKLVLPNTTIDSVAVDRALNACLVTATVTHPPAADHVKVFVALPLTGWNGRFRGNGGGGFMGGNPATLAGPVRQGFATAATDTGHAGADPAFAFGSDGLNWQEIRNFAHGGIHDMTVTGKAIVQAFYGRPARYSYFIGNSTGGRQGLMAAQRYPDDYDGILSGCPAINWHRFLAAALWPQVVMRESGNFVAKAKLDAATAAAVQACDAHDGVTDGVIDDPTGCSYDPQSLVGTRVGNETFTAADAEVVRKIWEGPRGADGSFLWYGLNRGTDLSTYAGTTGAPLAGKPFQIPLDWFRYFLVQNPRWDWTTMSRGDFELRWKQSVDEFASVIGTDNPDLSGFRDHGGKVIILHGLADQQIPSSGTIQYYERVLRQMGGREATAKFARLFLVPGVNHGFRGAPAPGPAELLRAIMRWVEDGQPPERLRSELRDPAGKLLRTRPVFPYPDRAVYKGSGNTDDEANFARRPPAQ